MTAIGGLREARAAHFDPFSGASGDMILGALIDAGAPCEKIHQILSTMPIPKFRLEANEVRVQGFRAVRLEVGVPHEHVHRHLADVERIIDAGSMANQSKVRARAVFRRLAEAEARVHGVSVDRIHFHEVGALDSIVDIVGAVVALELLCIESFTFSDLHDGTGTVRTAHGEVPVPVPAVVELTRGIPLNRVEVKGELLTPTGAAFLTALGRYEPAPRLIGDRIGVASGAKEIPGRPNLLRVSIGKALPVAANWWDSDQVVILETNLDDMTPELLGHIVERAIRWGALDAFVTPCTMKKGRPGHVLSLVVSPDAERRAVEFLLRETSTFGLRARREARSILRRALSEIETPWGRVRIKVGWVGDSYRITPEFESCREISERSGRPTHAVLQDVEYHIRSNGSEIARLASERREGAVE